jgi:N-acyl-D-amino-acid deacylase
MASFATNPSADREIARVFADYSVPGQPGCTVGVYQDGKAAYESAFGAADIEQATPLNTHSIFNLASVSKQFTAFMLLMLEQHGKLSLDDPFVHYVPELAASAQGVTLRQLLHHTGGLRDYIGLLGLQGRGMGDSATSIEALAVLARQRAPDFAAGTRYEYSNTGYFLLGIVIERVSGQSMAKFAEEHIFRPLGMHETYYVDRYPVTFPGLARGYAKAGNSFVIDESAWEQTGDGQLHSNIHDLALWDENFYTARVGGRALIDRMTETGILKSGERIDYAAGLVVTPMRGLPSVSHGGSWAGYRSQMLRFPQQHFSVIVLCNRDDAEAWRHADSIAELYLGPLMGHVTKDEDEAQESAKPAAGPAWQPGDLSKYEGAYFGKEADARCVIVERDSALFLESCAEGVQLRPGKPGEFVAIDDSFALRFPVDAAQVGAFDYDAEGLHGLHFERVAPPATLIVNAWIVDGTGAPRRKADLRIVGDRIVAVGELEPVPGEHVVDANGLTLTPGFIDTHSHHDREIFEQRDAMSAVSQGITTIVVGQDGGMTYPLKYLFDRLEQTPAAINVASYIGHGNVRTFVMGTDFARPATPEEIERMRQLVSEGMDYGALGLSTGLEYDPGIYSTTDELLVLAKEVARHGGRYSSHIRSEDRYLWAALDEIVRIGREAKIPVQVSHLKLAMVDWWGQSQRFLDVLERARDEGIDITGDIYPYEYWSANLGVLFPARDFSNRETAEFALKSIAPPEGLLITRFPPEPALEGFTIAQIAANRGTAPAEVLMDLTQRSRAMGKGDAVIATSMRSDDVAALMAWPHANICTDGSLAGKHPRGAGAFTKVLRLYARDQKLFNFEEAIHKMTGLSAAHMGFADRGVIRPGAYADLVLLDPEQVSDRSTIEEPQARSVGIGKVWVNGVVVLDDGIATGVYPGKVIRRAQP